MATCSGPWSLGWGWGAAVEWRGTVVPGHGWGRMAAGEPLAPSPRHAWWPSCLPFILQYKAISSARGVCGGVRPRMDFPRQRARQPWAASALPPVPGSTSPPFPPASRRGSRGCGVHPPPSPPPRGDAPLPALLLCFSQLCLLFETVVACPWRGEAGCEEKDLVCCGAALSSDTSPPFSSQGVQNKRWCVCLST